MKFEDNWPRRSCSKVWTEGRTDNGQMTTDDGWQVITIAHPEPSAQVS